jgi:hypothetical protein
MAVDAEGTRGVGEVDVPEGLVGAEAVSFGEALGDGEDTRLVDAVEAAAEGEEVSAGEEEEGGGYRGGGFLRIRRARGGRRSVQAGSIPDGWPALTGAAAAT